MAGNCLIGSFTSNQYSIQSGTATTTSNQLYQRQDFQSRRSSSEPVHDPTLNRSLSKDIPNTTHKYHRSNGIDDGFVDCIPVKVRFCTTIHLIDTHQIIFVLCYQICVCCCSCLNLIMIRSKYWNDRSSLGNQFYLSTKTRIYYISALKLIWIKCISTIYPNFLNYFMNCNHKIYIKYIENKLEGLNSFICIIYWVFTTIKDMLRYTTKSSMKPQSVRLVVYQKIFFLYVKLFC